MVQRAGGDPIYEFGAFRLDPAERLLLRAGIVVPLTPKSFDLLVYLVERHGRLVEKQALLAALWPDAIVEEANLASNVSALRKVLDNGSSGESLIQTVPTKGYRFVGALEGAHLTAAVTTEPSQRTSLGADAGFARLVLPTEAINHLSVALDNAPVSEILEMMANEDRRVLAAVHQEKERIEQGVEIITQALRTGGRLIFVGAGTSGRLGALEAAEMPPTFGTSPQFVRAIVPGGQEEVFRHRGQSEAEDRYEDGYAASRACVSRRRT